MTRNPGTPIFECGDATYRKQFAQSDSGAWHYRRTNDEGHFGRWIACDSRPDYAWYNPRAGRAHIKEQP